MRKGDHLFFTNGTRSEHITSATEPLIYFHELVVDINDRTETACSQARTFKVQELAMRAQWLATECRRSGPAPILDEIRRLATGS